MITFFAIIGFILFFPILIGAIVNLFKLLASIFLAIIVGAVYMLTFIPKSLPILANKWWAWLIQLPILLIQFIVIVGTYSVNELNTGISFVFFLQLIASGLIFNIQRIIQKDY